MKKRSTSDLTVEQKLGILAKLNFYARECDQKVDFGALGDVYNPTRRAELAPN